MAAKIKYYFDKKKSLCHMEGCRYLAGRKLNTSNMIEINSILDRGAPCKVCLNDYYISLGAKDFSKKREEYRRIFKQNQIGYTFLQMVYEKNKVKTELRGDRMYLQKGDDDFIIDINHDGVALWHGNYVKRDGGRRISRSGYHEHYLKESSLKYAMLRVANYNYSEKHKYYSPEDHETANQQESIASFTKKMLRKSIESEAERQLNGSLWINETEAE